MKRLLLLILILIMLCGCGKNDTVSVNSADQFALLDNKCKGWGYRRNKPRPEFTKEQISEMEKYGCIYMDNEETKNIYLTFDEGYENGYTSLILDVLREKGVSAAFFVTAPYVKNEPELIRRMAREGHIIGNHTVNHPSVPSLVTEEAFHNELTELDRLVYNVCKKRCKYFRPPKGEYSTRSLAKVSNMGYINTFWSLAYVDWDNKITAQKAKECVLGSLHNGAVILMHAVSKGNADALGEIIDEARSMGYEFKSLDEYGKG